MSHFYGTLDGMAKTKATRRGSKNGGLESFTASHEGAVRVTAWYNDLAEEDWVEVSLTQWMGHGIDLTTSLYRGPISRFEPHFDNELVAEWCRCDDTDLDLVIYGDDKCHCGIDNDHYHCHACRNVVQVG